MLFMGDHMQKRWLTVCLSILFILLLRHGSLNFEQSTKALKLWFETLVPSLFCMMVLVKVMFAFHAFDWLAKPLSWLCSRLFAINEQGFPYLVAMMFLGFPAGAAFINDAVVHHKLKPIEGQRLINTCSFATPGFVVLTLGSVIYQSVAIGMWLFLIQLCSGWILLIFTRKQSIHVKGAISSVDRSFMQALGSAMLDSGKTLYMMGGYLMLCMSTTSIILTLLPALFQFPIRILTEFSSGTMLLAAMEAPLAYQLIAISMLLAFGGLCVHLQVLCFSEATRVKYAHYLGFRILQAIIAGILAYVLFVLLHRV